MPYLTVEEKMSKDIFAEKIAEKLPPKAFAFYFWRIYKGAKTFIFYMSPWPLEKYISPAITIDII